MVSHPDVFSGAGVKRSLRTALSRAGCSVGVSKKACATVPSGRTVRWMRTDASGRVSISDGVSVPVARGASFGEKKKAIFSGFRMTVVRVPPGAGSSLSERGMLSVS